MTPSRRNKRSCYDYYCLFVTFIINSSIDRSKRLQRVFTIQLGLNVYRQYDLPVDEKMIFSLFGFFSFSIVVDRVFIHCSSRSKCLLGQPLGSRIISRNGLYAQRGVSWHVSETGRRKTSGNGQCRIGSFLLQITTLKLAPIDETIFHPFRNRWSSCCSYFLIS